MRHKVLTQANFVRPCSPGAILHQAGGAFRPKRPSCRQLFGRRPVRVKPRRDRIAGGPLFVPAVNECLAVMHRRIAQVSAQPSGALRSMQVLPLRILWPRRCRPLEYGVRRCVGAMVREGAYCGVPFGQCQVQIAPGDTRAYAGSAQAHFPRGRCRVLQP